MTAHDLTLTQPTHSRAPTPSPVVPLDLETQIERLEQRLVARESWVRSSAQSLGERAKQGVTPSSWVLPVLGVGAVLWLGWRRWHRHNPALPVGSTLPVNVAAHRVDRLADLPWAGLLELGWPLLPTAWRGRFSPAAATAATSALVSIARRLFGRRVS